MDDRRRYCASCAKPVELERRSGRRDECPACGAELHACVNCEHYDADRTQSCREPNAVAEEAVRDVRRGNFCQWFDHHAGPPRKAPADGDPSAAFDALFGRKPAARDPAKDAAEQAFAKLFKR